MYVSAAGIQWRQLHLEVHSQTALSRSPAAPGRSPSLSLQRSQWPVGKKKTHENTVFRSIPFMQILKLKAQSKERSSGKDNRKVCGYRTKDDPVALAILHFCSEIWCQAVFIDVAQQVTNRSQHHHLQSHSSQPRQWKKVRHFCFTLHKLWFEPCAHRHF